jgi:hypothetical protein
MDGILDRLFPQNQMLGLLGDENMTQQARQQGLLGLAAGLLQAGGPSRTRTNIGQALGSGLLAGQQMYNQAVNQQITQAGAIQKLQEAQRQRQQQELVRQVMPQLVTTERQQALTTGAQAADPLASLIQSADAGTLNQPAINQAALSTLRGALDPDQFKKVMESIKLQFEVQQPKREYKEVGGALYDVSGVAPKIVVGSQARPAGEVLEAMQVLGIQTPVNQLNDTERSRIQSYIDRKEERKAPKVSVDSTDPTAVARAQSTIVGDWRNVIKDSGAQEVADRYLSAYKAVEQGNAGNKAADGALIYSVGKIYDPSGAVQEGDKATILGNRNIPDRIKAFAQNVFSGASLLPSERNQLLQVVTEQVKSRAQSIDQQVMPYVQISKSLGGDGSLLRNPLSDALTRAQASSSVEAPSSLQEQAQRELERRRRRQ